MRRGAVCRVADAAPLREPDRQRPESLRLATIRPMLSIPMRQRSETIREVARLYIQRQREAVACCGDTSLTSCWILGELGRNGERSLSELAFVLGYDKSWTSRAVDALVAEGLVTKSGHASDGRRVTLRLTARGEARFEAINGALDAHARDVMRLVPAEKRKLVGEALSLLLEALRAEVASCR